MAKLALVLLGALVVAMKTSEVAVVGIALKASVVVVVGLLWDLKSP